MLFEEINEENDRNFLKLKLWIQDLNTKELKVGKDINRDLLICKGMFFVYIYGIFENFVKGIINRMVEIINERAINIAECSDSILTVLFWPEISEVDEFITKWIRDKDPHQAIASVIKKGSKVFNRNQHIKLSKNASSYFIKNNINGKVFVRLEYALGLGEEQVKSETNANFEKYIQEIANLRNSISHGEKLPEDVGKSFTTVELQKKYRNIEDVNRYLIKICEEYITDERYLNTSVPLLKS